MNPFKNILRLSLGDAFARALSFLAFIYLARVLGVEHYGTLEFAISVVVYLQLFSEGGLDLWATREVARGRSVGELFGQVLSLRLVVGLIGFAGLLLLLPVFPDYPQLKLLLVLFGLRAVAQALDLRWVFMGQQKMQWVAIGLIISQVIFAGAVFGLVRDSSDVLLVPTFQLLGILAMAGFFFYMLMKTQPSLRIQFSLSGTRQALSASFAMGASRGLALLSFNFDTLLIGFLLTSAAVGLYSAAYRPITAVLLLSSTYFLGLFPVLSHAFRENPEDFRGLVLRSLRLMTMLAIPFALGITLLAGRLVEMMFGPEYSEAAPVLQILSWSAALVLLRGTFRQALCAVGLQRVDLWCAGIATAVNVVLNFILIPTYGIIGAAFGTLISEIVWGAAVVFSYSRLTQALKPLPQQSQ